MASGQTITLRTLRRVLADGRAEGPSDRELLQRFADRRDEEAFAELLRRHGPLVLHTCRRVLHDHHAAEDVFQAAFLTLARRAGARAWHDSVANWLYTVAYRLALKVRGHTARRLAREQQMSPRPPAPDPLAEVTGRELCAALDEELSRLPTRYRVPLLLCCLQGLPRDEAARQLGWSPGALKGRLQRGRELLRKRLARRGLCLSAALASLVLSPDTGRAALPPLLLSSALRVAIQGTAAPARILALSEGVLSGMSVNKLKILAVVVLTFGLVAALAGSRTPVSGNGPEKKEPAVVARTPTDRFGDALPAGKETLTLKGHESHVQGLAYSPDGKRLASASSDKSICLWDAKTGREVRRLKGADKPMGCVAFAPDGRLLACAGGDGKVRLWDTATGEQVRELSMAKQWERSVAFSPDGKTLASASGDYTLWLLPAGIIPFGWPTGAAGSSSGTWAQARGCANSAATVTPTRRLPSALMAEPWRGWVATTARCTSGTPRAARNCAVTTPLPWSGICSRPRTPANRCRPRRCVNFGTTSPALTRLSLTGPCAAWPPSLRRLWHW